MTKVHHPFWAFSKDFQKRVFFSISASFQTIQIDFFFPLEMPSKKGQKSKQISPIIRAKSLFSSGDEQGAFAILTNAASRGHIMALYDVGFMMVKGIGCDKDSDGWELIRMGMELEICGVDSHWKEDGSVSELFKPQSLDFACLFIVSIRQGFYDGFDKTIS